MVFYLLPLVSYYIRKIYKVLLIIKNMANAYKEFEKMYAEEKGLAEQISLADGGLTSALNVLPEEAVEERRFLGSKYAENIPYHLLKEGLRQKRAKVSSYIRKNLGDLVEDMPKEDVQIGISILPYYTDYSGENKEVYKKISEKRRKLEKANAIAQKQDIEKMKESVEEDQARRLKNVSKSQQALCRVFLDSLEFVLQQYQQRVLPNYERAFKDALRGHENNYLFANLVRFLGQNKNAGFRDIYEAIQSAKNS